MNISNRMKRGSMSIVFTVLVVAAAIFINMIVGILADHYSLKYDMTKNKIYNISKETTKILKEIKIPVTITVLSNEKDFATGSTTMMVKDILDRYQASSNGNLKIKYIDIYKNPAITSQYPDLGNLAQNSIIVESSKRRTSTNVESLYQISVNEQTGESVASGFIAEQKITSAIDLVTKDVLPKTLVVTGHNEAVSETFVSLLKQSNYTVDNINLATENVPKDVSLIIIAAPKADYRAEEVKRLDAYLKSGGDMMVFYGTDSPTLPNLENYFKEYGVTFPKVTVFDPKRTISHPLQIAPYLAQTEMTQSLTDKADMLVITPSARQINLLFNENKTAGITNTPILVTGQSAYGKAYKDGVTNDSYDKAAGDKSGQFIVGLLSQKTNTVSNETKNTRILFLSSPLMMEDNILSYTNILNSYLLTYSFGYLDERSDTIQITPKNLVSSHINITGSAPSVIFLLLVILLPLSVIALGIYQWRKRRNL
ncbi:MAG: GldG family protein [Clostridiales bacterium]|nr:GldG family protein [Clostridiales bacterium]